MKKIKKLRNGENVFTWLLMAFSLFVLIMACRISGFSSISSPGMFPMVSATVMVITLLFLLIGNRKAQKPEAKNLQEELSRAAGNVFSPMFLLYTAIILIYMIALEPFHFLPCSLAFLLVSIILLKGSRPVKALFISVGTIAGIYLIFQTLFRVVLP